MTELNAANGYYQARLGMEMALVFYHYNKEYKSSIAINCGAYLIVGDVMTTAMKRASQVLWGINACNRTCPPNGYHFSILSNKFHRFFHLSEDQKSIEIMRHKHNANSSYLLYIQTIPSSQDDTTFEGAYEYIQYLKK